MPQSLTRLAPGEDGALQPRVSKAWWFEREIEELLGQLEPWLVARRDYQQVFGYHRLLASVVKSHSDADLQEWARVELTRVDSGPYQQLRHQLHKASEEHAEDIAKLKRLFNMRGVAKERDILRVS